MSVNSNVISLAKRPRCRVYRSLMFKRRDSTGEYESSWQTIPSYYVKSWGNASWGLNSDIRANFYTYQGMTLEVSNEDGFFNDSSDPVSFFSGYRSIYRSLVRVDAGYLDDSDNKYPSESIFLGIVGESVKRTDYGTLNFDVDHISKIFGEFYADRVAGLGSTQTASDIITAIRDHQDGNSVYIFQKYFSTGAWNIQTTTTNYNMATSTSLQGQTVWDLMKRLAEAENKLLFIDSTGDLYFQDIETTTTSVYHFSGPNDRDTSYGRNVIGSIHVDEDITNVYNRVKVKFAEPNTTTSYYTYNENWAWGDSSSSDIYGVREYKYNNEWLDSATAVTIATSIYNKFKNPVQKVKLKSKFVPGLEIRDRVTVTHRNGTQIDGGLFGSAVFGVDVFGRYDAGAVNFEEKPFFINHISHNVENFYTNLVLEEA